MAKFSMLQTVAVLLSLKNVSGHGYTSDPPSRPWMCSPFGPSKSKSAGCKQIGVAKWNMNNLGNQQVYGKPEEAVKKNICAAGLPEYKPVSHFPASDWEATPIQPSANGKFQFSYTVTTNHKTLSWQAYITKPGWTGETGELDWKEMDRFCENVVGSYQDGPLPGFGISVQECPFPKPTGNARDIILVLWDRIRGESGEMFFSCSDVIMPEDGESKEI